MKWKNYNRKRNKYHSEKIVVHGITFDSKKEATRYEELTLLEKSGAIQNLQRQVKYVLIPKQLIDGKVVERECVYIADFVYQVPLSIDKHYATKDGITGRITVNCGFETVVEDTKGVRTPDYIIKRKLMLFVHGIRIKEI